MINTSIAEVPFRGKNLVGKKFGRLTVLSLSHFLRSPKRPNVRIAIWLCRCACGHMTLVHAGALGGNTRSCGCLHVQELIERSVKHGHKRTRSRHRLYYTWQGMIQRCTNPKNRAYRWYGGKGIEVCPRWRNSFTAFLEDMEHGWRDGLTLERKDNSKGYSSENVVWATWDEQRKTMSRHRKSSDI
jgi:hypothetical protein